MSPFRARVARIRGAPPAAEVSDPWGGGHDTWKVGREMFACIGAVVEGVAVKCPDVETAEMLKDAGVAQYAPYFHKSWVRLPEDVDRAELAERIDLSYDPIKAKLPATVRKALEAQLKAE